MQEVPVGRMYLDGVEPGFEGAVRGRHERGDDLGQLLGRQRPRCCVARVPRAARPHRRPAALRGRDAALPAPRTVGRCLVPGVRQLDPGHRALALDERHDRGPGLHLVLGPQPGVLWADPALGNHRGGLGHHERCPAAGQAAEVDQVPGRRYPALVLHGVLAHGRDHDPVAQVGRAQVQGREQVGHGRHATGVCVAPPGPPGGLPGPGKLRSRRTARCRRARTRGTRG